MKIKIINNNGFALPQYETEGSAGMDVRAAISKPINLKPMERAIIKTGLYVELPAGVEAQVRARSGLAIKHGISLVNGIGTIDSDYRGEIGVILINLGDKHYTINRGDKIAQLVFMKYERVELESVEQLSETKRGAGGFGHTGV